MSQFDGVNPLLSGNASFSKEQSAATELDVPLRCGSVAVIVVAAGQGIRARGDAAATSAFVLPKQYRDLQGKPVLLRSLLSVVEALRFCKKRGFIFFPSILPVIRAEDALLYAACIAPALAVLPERDYFLPPCFGGATRADSVGRALTQLATGAQGQKWDYMLIHDGVRPFAPPEVFQDLLQALHAGHPAVACACPLVDALKRGQRAEEGGLHAAEALPNAELWTAQTPQGFVFKEILNAYKKAQDEGKESWGDEAELVAWAGLPILLTRGARQNLKLTTEEDFLLAEKILAGENAAAPRHLPLVPFETRLGMGFDIHAFKPGHFVWLGGIQIPHRQALEGHSDADVVLHALTDALLGSIGAGDIGEHFPPSDPRWKGENSSVFLTHACTAVRQQGGQIIFCDITVLCEAPKIGPYREAMRAGIAAHCGIDKERVSVKATTTEQLGSLGRGEGIAAFACATVQLPVNRLSS